ncbi:MAG: TetR family transcriptional regulator [Acidobacteriota bacterium]
MPASEQQPRDRSTFERVLDTAAELFWEKGYATTTTREIAAKVGIQQASLYHHVASKEELLYQLGASALNQLQNEVEAAVAAVEDPLEKIRVFIRAHLALVLQHQIRHVTLLTGLHGLTEAHRLDIVALRKRYGNLLLAMIRDAQSSGVIRTDIPADYLYLALLNLLNWTVFWFRPTRELSVEQVADLFGALFLDGAMPLSARSHVVRLSLPEPSSRRAAKRKAPRAAEKPTPERMLDRAAYLFATKGYAATSTREIATSLGMRKASLYYHIRTKEDLLHTVALASLEGIRSAVDAALEPVSDAQQRIRTLLATHIEHLLKNQYQHAAALWELHLLSPARRAEVVALRDSYEKMVRTEIQRAQTAGILRGDISAKQLSLSLLGLLNRCVMWYAPNGPLPRADVGALLTEVFLVGSRA